MTWLRWAGSVWVGIMSAAVSLAAPSDVAGAYPATAESCPDVAVIFARGTLEPAGLGATGQAFVDALRSRLTDTEIRALPVDYPASLDFARTADGVANASALMSQQAADCPETKLVLGGYSQGAAVVAYVTQDEVPFGYHLPTAIAGPLPTQVKDRVAAVVLFGAPRDELAHLLVRDAPPLTLGQSIAGRSITLCAPLDPVCEPGGSDRAAHSAYVHNGMSDTAADFVVDALGGSA